MTSFREGSRNTTARTTRPPPSRCYRRACLDAYGRRRLKSLAWRGTATGGHRKRRESDDARQRMEAWRVSRVRMEEGRGGRGFAQAGPLLTHPGSCT